MTINTASTSDNLLQPKVTTVADDGRDQKKAPSNELLNGSRLTYDLPSSNCNTTCLSNPSMFSSSMGHVNHHGTNQGNFLAKLQLFLRHHTISACTITRSKICTNNKFLAPRSSFLIFPYLGGHLSHQQYSPLRNYNAYSSPKMSPMLIMLSWQPQPWLYINPHGYPAYIIPFRHINVRHF